MQQNLKENLPSNHIYIHMNLVEAYICRSQEVIQSAYWSQTQVTIHQIVAYFKREEKLCHQYFVFISDEPRHDAKFVFALLCSLVAQLPKLILKLEYIHYWTDSPTSHNKTIFKIVSCHCKYLKIPSPSWNYMEAGHKKAPCDTIGGTAKQKADLAVKNEKVIIQDTQGFYQLAKTTQDTSSIKFTFLLSEEYENPASFRSQACNDIETATGTMKVGCFPS